MTGWGNEDRSPERVLTRRDLVQYVAAGLTRDQVAADLGCDRETVRRVEREQGLWLRPLPEHVGQWAARALRDSDAAK